MTTWDAKYFEFDDVTTSQLAARNGINNSLPPELDSAVFHTAHCMDEVREFLGSPVNVSSWYRCPELNKLLNGSNAHPSGYAVDFTSHKYGTPAEVFMALKDSGIKYDQLILEYDSWVHISFAPAMRQEALIINKKGKRRV